MLGSNASLPSATRHGHGRPIAHHSNSPPLYKKQSSHLLVTSNLSGVPSEQDRDHSAISTSKQASCTKPRSKASNDVLSNSTYNDGIGIHHGTSAKNIKAAATASQALGSNAGITSIPVEETEGGHKQSYIVLVGNSVRPVNTKLYASLPLRNKFLVKQQERNVYGSTIVKLVLKSSHESCMKEDKRLIQHHVCDNDVEADGSIAGTHYPGNNKRTGYIIYTCDRRFHGSIKYPLPNERASTGQIRRGGNGSVFMIYHEKKQYAVKKTVYRPNEVKIHSSLRHVNILPLMAVLMGAKHEKHAGRAYCYHFMPKMDYDLRQILSTREVGCLKFFYRNHLKNRTVFDRAFGNVKFVLRETLKALAFIHSSGYVHRDVKASNIMIRLNCSCNPLYCDCTSKFQVKLGDFDSSGTIPGLHVQEPTDQLIKFASILPLGTPGYRAPEVSMHITLSGPYETLYTTAVDMWSFGCLCLNICIGKTAALSQREEASLLLSTTHNCGEELWTKTTKIHEIQRTHPFCSDINLLKLIKNCLQVNYKNRPSALESLSYLL